MLSYSNVIANCHIQPQNVTHKAKCSAKKYKCSLCPLFSLQAYYIATGSAQKGASLMQGLCTPTMPTQNITKYTYPTLSMYNEHVVHPNVYNMMKKCTLNTYCD